ncbi:hypothetical protein BD309DRAFT_826899, partial [Dichomitus squalens]
MGICQQILPILDQVSQATGLDLAVISVTVLSQQGSHGLDNDLAVKVEDDVPNVFSQFTLNEHGYLHWISNSLTMSLNQQLKEAMTSPLHRVLLMEEDLLAPGRS